MASTIVTASTSPRRAPLTNKGPVSGCTRFKLAAATVAGVEVRLKGLSSASRVSKITVSPGLAVAAGRMAGCQRLWHVPSVSLAQGTGTVPTRVMGIRIVLADEGPAAATSTMAAVVNTTLFMTLPPGKRNCAASNRASEPFGGSASS